MGDGINANIKPKNLNKVKIDKWRQQTVPTQVLLDFKLICIWFYFPLEKNRKILDNPTTMSNSSTQFMDSIYVPV